MSTGGWGTLLSLELDHVRAEARGEDALDRDVGGVAPELDEPDDFDFGDRFDVCDGRSLTFERCSLEAGHGGPCRFLNEDDGAWPDDDDPPDPL